MKTAARRTGHVAAIVCAIGLVAVSCAGVPPRLDLLELERRTAQLSVPTSGPVTIVALGDTGKGTADQRRVAEAARAVCEAEGCDLGFLLGDNIYDRGIARVDDPRFDEVMSIYDTFGFPFLVILGNHDYGSPLGISPLGGIGLDENRAEAQMWRIAHTRHLHMPGRHWRFAGGGIEIVGLDTQPWFWRDQPSFAKALSLEDDAHRQERDLRRWNIESRASFRIALGHHPLVSAGPHGDAGRADGVPRGLVFSDEHIRQQLEKHVIGHFDIYLAGHDHNLQDVGPRNGTELIVSGGGSEKKPVQARTDVIFSKETLGFVVLDVEPRKRQAHLRFFGVDAAGHADVIHERMVEHAPLE